MTFNFGLSSLGFLKRHWFTLAVVIISAVGAWWGFSAWSRARETRLATETGALQSEISNLKSQAAAAEKHALVAEGQTKELRAEVQRHETVEGQLAGQLKNLQAAAATEQARIAALPADQLGPELQKTIATAGILRFAQDDTEGARRVLEIITDRNTCLERSTVNSQLLSNCRESLVDYGAIGDQQALEIRDLKEALDLEKRAFDKRDDLAKVQVKTAQGTWIHRVWNRVKFPVGVVLGGVGGYAVGKATTR
jgi:hypothetical protein